MRLSPPSIYLMFWKKLPFSSYLMFDVRAPWGLSDSVSPNLSSLLFLVFGVWIVREVAQVIKGRMIESIRSIHIDVMYLVRVPVVP
jgi:hypothetical protein